MDGIPDPDSPDGAIIGSRIGGPQPPPHPGLCKAAILRRGTTGEVCCLWMESNWKAAIITKHNGAESKVLGRFPAREFSGALMRIQMKPVSFDPLCYMDSRGDVWLSLDYSSIYRMDTQGRVEKIYDLPVSISAAFMDTLPKPEMARDPAKMPKEIQLGVYEDMKGRVIFYSQMLMISPFVIEGAVICDQGQFTQSPPFTGLASFATLMETGQSPSGPLGVRELLPRDDKTAWLRPMIGRLSTLDVETGLVSVIPEPAPGAFKMMLNFVKQDNTLIALCESGCWAYDGSQWRHIYNKPYKLTPDYMIGSITSSPAAKCTGGAIFILGGDGFGYIPDGESTARTYNCENDTPITSSQSVYALPESQVLLLTPRGVTQVDLASNVSTASETITPETVLPEAPPSLVILPDVALSKDAVVAGEQPVSIAILHMAQTYDGRLWALKGGADGNWDGLLSLWDGSVWTAYIAPLKPGSMSGALLRRDFMNRLWIGDMKDTEQDSPIAIFDTGLMQWKQYASYRVGYEALGRDLKGFAFDNQPWHKVPDPINNLMNAASGETCFSGDGRVLIWRDANEAELYDGAVWTVLPTAPEWFGGVQPSNVYFMDNGKIAANLRTQSQSDTEFEVWIMKGENQWEKAPGEKPAWPAARLREASLLVPSADRPFGQESVSILDNYGVWWSWQMTGKLRRNVQGKEMDAFPSEYTNPFDDDKQPGPIFGDAMGNTFVITGAEAFIVRPSGPLPDTVITQTSSDPERLEYMASSATTDVFFSWRVDKNQWSPLTDDPVFKVPALSPGKHRLRVRACTTSLDFDRTAADVYFEVSASDTDIAAWIGKLCSEHNTDREAAARSLRANPIKDKQALEASLATTSDDEKWWISGVLESIRVDAERAR